MQWTPVQRDYEAEIKNSSLPREDAPLHPLTGVANPPTKSPSIILTPIIPVTTTTPTTSPLSSDPLGGLDDPLGGSILNSAKVSESKNIQKEVEIDFHADSFAPWSAMKSSILQTYTTDEQIGVQVTFMNSAAQGKPKPTTTADKVKSRVEQLDQTEEDVVKENMLMTQKDYVAHIESLHAELIAAWDSEERVKSLKLAIQCAKLLNDTQVAKFYPSKFVLVTEILDTFGNLVYDRIKRRSVILDVSGTPKEKLAKQQQEISDTAKETCRNWFYKIASIRELLPRLYVEMAIIKSYEFLKGDPHTEFVDVINRMSKMVRGIGNPLVQAYARTYLARKGNSVLPKLKGYIMDGFNDFIYTHKANLESEKFQKQLKDEMHVTKQEYLGLYSPSLEWTLQCIAHGAPQETLDTVISKYTESKNSIVLNHIISSFHPDFIASRALSLTALIRESDPETYPRFQLYRTLGVNLVLGAPPRDQILAILNDVWKVVKKFENIQEYISVAEVFIEYPLKHCSQKEANILLGDILAHVTVDKAYEKLQSQLQSIVLKILTHYHDFDVLTAMDNLLPLLDLFFGETQVQVAKAMLEAFCAKSNTQESTSDPLSISTMLSMGKALHDSLNTLSFQDEIRQAGILLSQFIRKVDFGRDVEKQLNFYVECRQAFTNIDVVKARLVLGVCNLAVRTLNIVKGKHNKKTAAFVRACLAYCYITIPSMEDIFNRLNLYHISAAVALMNQSLPQVDSFLKAAITLIQEVPPLLEQDTQLKSTEDQLVGFFQQFLSLLVVVPGHPEHGALYLVKGLLKVVKDYQWEKGTTGKARVLISTLILFSTFSQTNLPYKVDKVEANDTLYAGDSEFSEELVSLSNKLLEDILEEFGKFKEDPDPQNQKKYAKVILDLFNTTVSFAELNPKSATLAVNLFTLAKKCCNGFTGTEITYSKNSLAFVDNIKSGNTKLIQELSKKLKSI